MTFAHIIAFTSFSLHHHRHARCSDYIDPGKWEKFMQLKIESTTNENTKLNANTNKNIDEASGKCKFGLKSYWDDMYNGVGDRPADSYSWYCGWYELSPFWTELVADKSTHVLVAGVGNDLTPVHLYDAGWNKMTAFDYSQAGVDRCKELLGPHRMQSVTLLNADARNLPLLDSSVGATLDKGTLDAIYITGVDAFQEAVEELGRVTVKDGVVISISSVVPSQILLDTFDSNIWEGVHNGELAFAPDGEATIDLGADLYSWRRL